MYGHHFSEEHRYFRYIDGELGGKDTISRTSAVTTITFGGSNHILAQDDG